MKLIWLLVFICFFQVSLAQKVYIGIKGGAQITSSYLEHSIFSINLNTTFLSRANGGFLVRYLPKKGKSYVNSGIELGINYVQKGWKQLFLINGPSYVAKLNYLEIPIQGIGYFGKKNNVFLSLGFYLEFLINEDLDVAPSSSTLGNSDFYTYDKNRDRKVGYGSRLGIGVFRDLSIGTFQLEGFFSYSFSNFIDAGDLTTKIPNISHQWTLGATIGYMILVKKPKE